MKSLKQFLLSLLVGALIAGLGYAGLVLAIPAN